MIDVVADLNHQCSLTDWRLAGVNAFLVESPPTVTITRIPREPHCRITRRSVGSLSKQSIPNVFGLKTAGASDILSPQYLSCHLCIDAVNIPAPTPSITLNRSARPSSGCSTGPGACYAICMADDKSKARDRRMPSALISMKTMKSAGKFGCTPDQQKAAVKKVGVMAEGCGDRTETQIGHRETRGGIRGYRL